MEQTNTNELESRDALIKDLEERVNALEKDYAKASMRLVDLENVEVLFSHLYPQVVLKTRETELTLSNEALSNLQTVLEGIQSGTTQHAIYNRT